MYRDDDTDFGVSTSSAEYFTRGGSELQKKILGLKKEIESGKTLRQSEQNRQNLHTHVDLSLLSQKINDGQKDDEKKRQEKQQAAKQAEKGSKMGTKTIKQMEQAQVQDAGTRQSADDLIKQEENEAEEESQAQQEYQAQMG